MVVVVVLALSALSSRVTTVQEKKKRENGSDAAAGSTAGKHIASESTQNVISQNVMFTAVTLGPLLLPAFLWPADSSFRSVRSSLSKNPESSYTLGGNVDLGRSVKRWWWKLSNHQ